MKHTISVLVENRFGELARIVGLFGARACNIESLSVAPTHDPEFSRVTIVTTAPDQSVEQITKQLAKQVRVIEAVDLSLQPSIERDLALFNLKADDRQSLLDVLNLVSTYRLKVVAQSADGVVVEATGRPSEIDQIIRAIPYSALRGVTRTGTVALALSPDMQPDMEGFLNER